MIPISHQYIARIVYHSYFKHSYENRNTDIQVYSQDSNGIRYIAFPGTFSLKDWWRNLQVHSAIMPYQDEGYLGAIRLHKGYYLGYRSIQERVLELCHTNLALVFGGHSSGGCYAQIAGVDVNYRLGKQVEVITFGTPACGNKAWAKSARNRIVNTSYANFGDLIPYLLFWNSFVSDSISNQLIFLDPHDMKNYVKAINNIQVYRW